MGSVRARAALRQVQLWDQAHLCSFTDSLSFFIPFFFPFSLFFIFPSFFPSLGVSFNSVYTQIWRVLLHLAADPFPEVSDLAMKVLNSIAYKVCCVSALIRLRSRNLDPFSGLLSTSCNFFYSLLLKGKADASLRSPKCLTRISGSVLRVRLMVCFYCSTCEDILRCRSTTLFVKRVMGLLEFTFCLFHRKSDLLVLKINK